MKRFFDRTAYGLVAAALLGLLAWQPALAQQQQQRNLKVVELRLPGQAPQRLYGESHALVIGASRYNQGWSKLPGVAGDIAAVGRLLSNQGFKVEMLADPSRDQLDAGLRRFASRYGQNPANRLLVYFAGHGHTLTTAQGKKLGYLVPVDAPRPDRDAAGFKEQAYSMENIEVLSRQIEAKHVLFLFDSCFSGSIFRSRSGVPDTISDKTAKPVRLFITAGDEAQTVPDESIFRRQLEAALGPDAEADYNKDGYITGTELGSFLEDKVTNYSKRAQTPRFGKLNDPDLDKGDFVFASLVVEQVRLTPPPPGQSTGPGLEALKKEDATRKQWAAWQARMKADFDATAGFDGGADLQIKAWEQFLSGWAQDNPLSRDDESLRAQAQQRLVEARRLQALAAVPFSAPVVGNGFKHAKNVCKSMGKLVFPPVNWSGVAIFKAVAKVEQGGSWDIDFTNIEMKTEPEWKAKTDAIVRAFTGAEKDRPVPISTYEKKATRALRGAIEDLIRTSYQCQFGVTFEQEFQLTVE